MRYSIDDLYACMAAEKPVRVTTTDGAVFEGQCWAEGPDFDPEDEHGEEACLIIGHTVLYQSEIDKIEPLK